MGENGTIGQEFEEDLTGFEEIPEMVGESENVSHETFDFDILQKIKDLLLTPQSDLPIEEYADHPINYNGRKSGTYLARFIEAFTGSLKLAIFDLIKFFYYMNEEKKNGGSNESQEL
jgi:hypothetical protein